MTWFIEQLRHVIHHGSAGPWQQTRRDAASVQPFSSEADRNRDPVLNMMLSAKTTASLMLWEPQHGRPAMNITALGLIHVEALHGTKNAADRADRKLSWALAECSTGQPVSFALAHPNVSMISVGFGGGSHHWHLFRKPVRVMLDGIVVFEGEKPPLRVVRIARIIVLLKIGPSFIN